MPNTPTPDGPLLLTPKEAAAQLSVSREYIYRLCAAGEIESVLLRGSGARSRRIVRSSLIEWVHRQPSKSPNPPASVA